jgi:hypothetical protein
MMEAARTSETSVDIQLRTRQYIPEDSELQPNYCYKISKNISYQVPSEVSLEQSHVAVETEYGQKA